MEILLKAFLAAIITLILERAPKIYESIVIRRKHFSLIGDTWKSFHYTTRKGKPEVIESDWTIKRGTLSPFKVTFEQPGLKYKGRIIFEGDDRILVYAKATTQNETVVYRFPNPLPSNGDSVSGLWMSYDHDKNIASGGSLLTRESIAKEEAKPRLISNIVSSQNERIPLITVRSYFE